MTHLLLLALLAQSAPALPTAEGYCRFVGGVARSQSALQLSPELFAQFGIVNGADALAAGGVTLPPTERLTAGAGYSLSRLYQGLVERDRAEADCRRFFLVNQLWAFVVSNDNLRSGPALRAKVAVLSGALPRAEQLLGETRQAVRLGRATADQLAATELRVADLKAENAAAEEELRGLDRYGPPPAPVPALLRRRDEAELETEKLEARLREAQAVDLVFKAGYDRVWGVRDYLPLFGTVMLSFNPGLFWQPRAEAEAASGRVAFVHEQIADTDERTESTLTKLRAELPAEEKRLAEAELLRRDLAARLASVAALHVPKVEAFRDVVWFDLVKARADEAYARARVAELRGLLGER